MVCKCFHVERTLPNRGGFALVQKYTRKSNGKLKAHHFSYIKDRQLLQTSTIPCDKAGCLFYVVLLKSCSCSTGINSK